MPHSAPLAYHWPRFWAGRAAAAAAAALLALAVFARLRAHAQVSRVAIVHVSVVDVEGVVQHGTGTARCW